jgi:transcriptional regulator with XRE-family HTH domain
MEWYTYVRATRKRLGLTQEQFARLLGVSPPAVQRWEYGISKPSLLQADIINQINDHMNDIERVEQEKNTSIGELLKTVLIGGGIAFGMYQLFKIIFDERKKS